MFRTSLMSPGLANCIGRSITANIAKLSITPLFIRSLSLKPDFSKFRKIPTPPGYIIGTVNDAYRIPLVSYWEGSYHWVYERIIAIALIPLATVPFFAGVQHPMFDTIFSIGLLWHIHAGIKSCIIDYIPERIWGFWHRLAGRLLTIGTFVSMYGIYVIETANNGLYDLIKLLWQA